MTGAKFTQIGGIDLKLGYISCRIQILIKDLMILAITADVEYQDDSPGV